MRAEQMEPRLVSEACNGSEAAFESLVIIYEPRVRRMIYNLTRDVQLTQDLCQEVFLAAYRALPRMRGKELHFAPWLYRIALNQVRSEWRRRKHVTLISLAAASGNGGDIYSEPVEEWLISDEVFEERVLERELVMLVLARLPSNSAKCLLLDAEGYSNNEIAETMQDSLAAIRSRLSRARQSFQQLYNRLEQR